MNGWRLIAGGEGFQIFTETRNGRVLLIIDESTTIDPSSEENAEDLNTEQVLDFATEEARTANPISVLSRIDPKAECS